MIQALGRLFHSERQKPTKKQIMAEIDSNTNHHNTLTHTTPKTADSEHLIRLIQ
jgi:hypothetical protein